MWWILWRRVGKQFGKKQYNLLMKQFMKKEDITGDLKATNQMEWVQKMNNIKNTI